ncbi:reverse transcriptase/maturase family protein [uncultured Desulfuromonas sp.]|uniref:reverse transcriptase/maturase family protein n=1 Tax=uncultured Desulfuromonas sp. TaxID=181013 RepID=UPI002AAA6796|nr:reverse transcriptase/maturase family protein [uncultured Desulfuromonas sp.]
MNSDDLYSRICRWDNLLLAWRKAAKGKRGTAPVAHFEYRLEDNLVQLGEELHSQTYCPGSYHSFYIHDPKRRLISAAPFRDRVVHHALCHVIEPLFERRFVTDSFANRVGKGNHRALDRAQHYARQFPYVLTLDLQQYFPSIDHALLRAVLARQIKDKNVLKLIDLILESGRGVLDGEYTMRWFSGDDLLAVERARGLPIGNLTSQFWANCYLDPFDHFVKRELRCPGYVRYVDDMLLFSNDKKELWLWKKEVMTRLADLRLTVHERSAQVRPVREGMPFLGFVVYPHKRRLKRRKEIAYARKLRKLLSEVETGNASPETVVASVNGWCNHVVHGNTVGLRRAVLRNILAFSRNPAINRAIEHALGPMVLKKKTP